MSSHTALVPSRRRALSAPAARPIFIIAPLSNTAKVQQTFTCFKKLPPELRLMIWDEALTGPCVIFFRDSQMYTGVNDTDSVPTYHGFDFLPVALSCKEANARFCKLHPRVTFGGAYLEAGKPTTIHANMNSTIFAGANAQQVQFFLDYNRHNYPDFRPLHFAMEDFYGNDGLEIDGLDGYNISDSQEYAEVRAARGIQGMRVPNPPIQSLVKYRYVPGHTRDFLAKTLADVTLNARPLVHRLNLASLEDYQGHRAFDDRSAFGSLMELERTWLKVLMHPNDGGDQLEADTPAMDKKLADGKVRRIRRNTM